MVGGKNVVYHREHRSKKGRRDHHYLLDGEYWDRLNKKAEKRIEKEEKDFTNLAY